ncbi:hypothetical protein [Enhygromyxa salina]|uniref:Uncharacterized protein n=1 Tax=Enhygromyxa salina TaxID=215803 RepID=A0A2S9YS47_9BACT|nr:hypothetical protein [Enhygromyxa salina]PRQ07872.1 hypothetical protein ENSA7_24370 [Enhygromyxa salina]
MTLDEFAQLQANDLVECAGIERRVVRNYGHEVDLTDAEGVLTVRREYAGRICLLHRANPDAPLFRDPWVAVAPHLQLVNLVRARIGQRPIDRNSNYSPADIEADARFYAATQSWARARARELGIAS